LEKEFDINVDWRGFELHPETPKGGIAISRFFPADRIQGMGERIKTFATSFGILDMRLPERLQNTRSALAMAEYARDQDKLGTFRLLAMDAYWKDGNDLEDKNVLLGLAAASGLDPREAVTSSDLPEYLSRVDSVRDEANKMGIQGIPTFIIGIECIVGCQPYEVLADAVLRAGGVPKRQA
jgi:predicted DsbA family dithiol-disulfide isomerase